jgi:hypothetical protein
MAREEHPISADGPSSNRTCYFCHELCAAVAMEEESPPVYYVDTLRHFCICVRHRYFEGRHGEAADPARKPKDALSVARYIKSSTHKKNRPAPRLVIKHEDEDVEVGEVVDEVAAFLKKMGKIK